MEVCHNNGDPLDSRLENLRYDTHSANQLDTVRHGGNPLLNRPACNHGHPWTPENTMQRGDGGRRCRACDSERAKRKRRAAKENPPCQPVPSPPSA